MSTAAPALSSAPADAPPRPWLKAALHALSPPSASKTSAPPLPLADHERQPPTPQIIHRLSQLVTFLEENYRREEGLYRRQASKSECAELQRLCVSTCNAPLPTLDGYNVHVVTTTIKSLLEQDLQPIIPYTANQTLLERVSKQDDAAALKEIMLTVQQAPTYERREFLQLFLGHLHHISTSIPCRMSPKELATQIGVLLIQPTEDAHNLATKDMLKQRRRLARLMIENAASITSVLDAPLAEKCSTEANTSTVHKADPPEDSRRVNSAHYVQVMWDQDKTTHSEESLKLDVFKQALLEPFGNIAMLAINDSRNRAIVAFRELEGADTAANTEIEGLRVRCRKLRAPNSGEEFNAQQPRSRMTSMASEGLVEGEAVSQFHEEDHERNTGGSRGPFGVPTDLSTSENSPRFLHKLERPPSILLVQKAMQTMQSQDEMTLEDVESVPSSPAVANRESGSAGLSVIEEAADELERSSVEPIHAVVAVQPRPAPIKTRRSLKDILTGTTTVGNVKRDTDKKTTIEPQQSKKLLLSPSNSVKTGLIRDIKSMLTKTPKSPSSSSDLRAAVAAETFLPTDIRPRHNSGKPVVSTRSARTQTVRTITSLQDRATDTQELPQVVETKTTPACDSCGTMASTVSDVSIRAQTLETCLRAVQLEFQTLVAALGASSQTNVHQAIHRAHARLATEIKDALASTDSVCSPDHHENRESGSSATSEFVTFLETRASTQVKILEAEVRAGQELLRLHRTQHQTEITELEGEIAGLRVARTETEKLCAELRSELRKSRTELSCHIASAASIQRDKRDVDEKMIIWETKLRAKEQELQQLQIAHGEMRDVAAQAQRRLDEHRGVVQVPSSSGSKTTLPRLGNKEMDQAKYPKTVAFLDKHHHRVSVPAVASSSSSKQAVATLAPGRYTNSTELAAMKDKLQQQIQAQVEMTKAALNDMDVFGYQQEDDADLEQLQQQLASAQAEMDVAMGDSRRQLDELLDPSNRFTQSDATATNWPSHCDSMERVERLIANAARPDLLTHHGQERDDQSIFQSQEPPIISRWRDQRLDGVQSEMYKKWARQRPNPPMARAHGKPPTSAKIRSDNNDSLRQAQLSMQRFQETLATVTRPTNG